ncbi:MAG: nuclease, partial [Microbacterium sp.]
SLAGLERFDLEFDARVFDAPLPRVRVIPIDEFDPTVFLR